MTDRIEVTVGERKYKWVWDRGRLTCYRHGEEWRNETGDNAVSQLLFEIDRLRGVERAMQTLIDSNKHSESLLRIAASYLDHVHEDLADRLREAEDDAKAAVQDEKHGFGEVGPRTARFDDPITGRVREREMSPQEN